MSFYEIINPSDPVTLEADDVQAARLAVFLLGRGRYGLEDENGKLALRIYFFGATPEALKADNLDLEAFFEDPAALERAAKVLDTTAVCRLLDRKALVAAVGNDPAAIERWNEEKRSSMNNICKAARSMAAALREKAAAVAAGART